MEEELTLVTKELLLRTENLKKCTMDSMVIGDNHIVRGIVIFEETLKEINPEEITDEVVSYMEKVLTQYVLSRSGRNTNFIRYGIFLSTMILDNYQKEKIFRKKR